MATANILPLPTSYIWSGTTESAPSTHLRQKVAVHERLYQAQPALIRQFIEEQAARWTQALMDQRFPADFQLPERIVSLPDANGDQASLPLQPASRKHMVSGLKARFLHQDRLALFSQILTNLEQGPDPAVSMAASLLRYAVARQMIHDRLPAGKTVSYQSAEGEEIPSIPIPEDGLGEDTLLEGDGLRLQPASNTYARRFFLPEWVPFDEAGNLLVGSVQEAEAQIVSMQNLLQLLQTAATFAPYIVADSEYQRKRYGILGQLVNQGRALAQYWTGEIIETVKKRAISRKLNRGLQVRLPFFDDRELQMKSLEIVVIPPGWVMFMPAFVVRAVREEQAKVACNPTFSFSTRKYLLIQLDTIEQAFLTTSQTVWVENSPEMA